VVETEKHVGDDEPALRQAGAPVGERHRRFEPRDVVVGEVTDDRLRQPLGLVDRDEPVAATDERVAAQPALVDGLEQERGAAAGAQVEVGRERGDECGVDGRRHGKRKRPSRVVGAVRGSSCASV
jgi:hypothetical protein